MTSRRRAWGLIACLLAAPAADALLGLWQFATASGPESFQIGRYVRAYGTLGKPNPLAGYLNMAWPTGLALSVALGLELWRGRRGLPRGSGWRLLGALLCGTTTLLLLAGLGATYSRGGWVGAAACLPVMAACSGRRGALLAASMTGLLVLGIVLGSNNLLPASIAGRIDSITENLRIFDAAKANVNDANFAVVERMAHWQAGWRMFLDHPLTGVGPGNFNLAYRHYFVGRWYISQGHAHNYYIHIAAEAGVPGLIAYLALIAASWRAGLRAIRRASTAHWRAVAVGGCGIIAAVAAHQLFENLHVLNLGIQLCAVWGLLVAIARQESGGQERESGGGAQ